MSRSNPILRSGRGGAHLFRHQVSLGTLVLGWFLLAGALMTTGCGEPPAPPARQTLTYTFDAPTREIIRLLAEKLKAPAYENFDKYFKGLLVPESLLPLEPFVLGLSTESKIPAVLLLDAPWVQRYGVAGWLYELEATKVFAREELAAPVAEAFSVLLPKAVGKPVKELVAVPTTIKGNILFYRRDLLQKYQVKPPRTWDELAAACRLILPRERQLRYGLIFHATNFMNDFYPILWGYGAEVVEGESRLVLGEKQNLEACLAALRDLKGWMGSLAPRREDLRLLEAAGSLRRTFYRGEALFMINWNTRITDLREMIRTQEGGGGALRDLSQVGVAPIPCRAGHAHRYSNIGSFGWAVNRFAVTHPRVIEEVQRFMGLVAEEHFQLLAAEHFGQVPALRRALKKVTNKEVLQVYQDAFAVPDMVLKPRPFSRRLNNILEKHLVGCLFGEQTPEEALQRAIQEYKTSEGS